MSIFIPRLKSQAFSQVLSILLNDRVVSIAVGQMIAMKFRNKCDLYDIYMYTCIYMIELASQHFSV